VCVLSVDESEERAIINPVTGARSGIAGSNGVIREGTHFGWTLSFRVSSAEVTIDFQRRESA